MCDAWCMMSDRQKKLSLCDRQIAQANSDQWVLNQSIHQSSWAPVIEWHTCTSIQWISLVSCCWVNSLNFKQLSLNILLSNHNVERHAVLFFDQSNSFKTACATFCLKLTLEIKVLLSFSVTPITRKVRHSSNHD